MDPNPFKICYKVLYGLPELIPGPQISTLGARVATMFRQLILIPADHKTAAITKDNSPLNTPINTCVIVVSGPRGSKVQSTTELGHDVRIYM